MNKVTTKIDPNLLKNVELAISGIQCDHCEFKDDSVKVEDYKDWLNKECPECGFNLLTQKDYDMVQALYKAVDTVNAMTPEEAEQKGKLIEQQFKNKNQN